MTFILALALALALAITPDERFESLVKQYEGYPKGFRTELEYEKIVSNRFVEIAQMKPSDPVAFEALDWVVTNISGVAAADQAMDLLSRDHIKSDRLLPIIQRLDQFLDTTPAEIGLLRAALRDSPHRNTRAWACLVLGRTLAKRKRTFEVMHARLALTLTAHPVLKSRLGTTPEGQDDVNLASMGEEAEKLFERLVEEFGDFEDLAETAQRELFELRHLSVGSQAPEIEGRDIDGRPFRLSDYRGKVIVLYFWSQRCGVCVASFPRFRQYVKQFEGRPFGFLGVNCGDKASDLISLRQRGEVTWRFWWDGLESDKGRILESWNIWLFPTMYVIDPQGIIRYRDLRNDLIPTAVDILLPKSGTKPQD